MSGVKRITVDQQAWTQAQRAAARLRDVNRELPGMIDALRRDQQAAAERAKAEIRARQDAVDRALAGLSEQTRKMQAETSRRLREQADRFRAQTRSVAEQSRRESRAAAEDTEQRLSAALAREQQERTRQAKALRDELAVLRQDRGRALTSAKALLDDSRLLGDVIDRQLPHERFAPGRLADLNRRLDIADTNVAQGLGEAALAQAQDLFLQMSELRAEVESRDQEWQAAKITADSAITVLTEQIRVNTDPEVVDEDGKKIEGVTLDVDFWSEGELSALRETVREMSARVSDTGTPPSLAELRDITEREAPSLDEKLTQIVSVAQARQMASQVRVNLAELVVSTLEESTGYTWEEGQAIYANGDQRRAFYSKLRHLDNSEIVVEVSPDETGADSCVLRILSYDAGTPDEEERVRRAHAVADSLRQHGLKVGLPTADREQPDPRLTDFDTLRKPRPTRTTQATAAADPGQV